MPKPTRRSNRSLAAFSLSALTLALPMGAAAQRAQGAPAARTDSVVEQFHGNALPDPYRGLEDTQRPEVRDWMQKQSDATQKLLASIDGRDALAARIAEVTAAAGDRITDVTRMPGERWYYLKRARGERQFRLVMREGLNGAERTLVDPEVESRAHGVPHAVNFYTPSWDGRYVAFGISAGGSENATLHVLDVKSGQRVGEPLVRVDWSPIHWLADSRSFTVTQKQVLRKGQPETDTYKYARVLWQKVGARAAAAKPVFGPRVTSTLGLDPLDNGELITVPGSAWMVARPMRPNRVVGAGIGSAVSKVVMRPVSCAAARISRLPATSCQAVSWSSTAATVFLSPWGVGSERQAWPAPG